MLFSSGKVLLLLTPLMAFYLTITPVMGMDSEKKQKMTKGAGTAVVAKGGNNIANPNRILYVMMLLVMRPVGA